MVRNTITKGWFVIVIACWFFTFPCSAYGQVRDTQTVAHEELGIMLNEVVESRLVEFTEALSWYSYNCDLQSASSDYRGDNLCLNYLIAGLNAEQACNYNEAVTRLRNACDVDLQGVSNFIPYFDLGRVYYHIGDFESAVESLSKYLAGLDDYLADPILARGTSGKWLSEQESCKELCLLMFAEMELEQDGEYFRCF